MKVLKTDVCLDGGTIKIVTTEATYCIDNRFNSTTVGAIYLGYPKNDYSNYSLLQDIMKMELRDAVDVFFKGSGHSEEFINSVHKHLYL